MQQCRANTFTDCLCHRRWERVAYLTILSRFSARKLPRIVGTPALYTSHHLNRKARRFDQRRRSIWARRIFDNTLSINEQLCPGGLCSSWAKISTAVLLASAYNCRPYPVGESLPLLGILPAIRCHQVKQHVTNAEMLTYRWIGPAKVPLVFKRHSNKHESRAKLRNPEVGRRKQLPLTNVTKLKESV